MSAIDMAVQVSSSGSRVATAFERLGPFCPRPLDGLPEEVSPARWIPWATLGRRGTSRDEGVAGRVMVTRERSDPTRALAGGTDRVGGEGVRVLTSVDDGVGPPLVRRPR